MQRRLCHRSIHGIFRNHDTHFNFSISQRYLDFVIEPQGDSNMASPVPFGDVVTMANMAKTIAQAFTKGRCSAPAEGSVKTAL